MGQPPGGGLGVHCLDSLRQRTCLVVEKHKAAAPLGPTVPFTLPWSSPATPANGQVERGSKGPGIAAHRGTPPVGGLCSGVCIGPETLSDLLPLLSHTLPTNCWQDSSLLTPGDPLPKEKAGWWGRSVEAILACACVFPIQHQQQPYSQF